MLYSYRAVIVNPDLASSCTLLNALQGCGAREAHAFDTPEEAWAYLTSEAHLDSIATLFLGAENTSGAEWLLDRVMTDPTKSHIKVVLLVGGLELDIVHLIKKGAVGVLEMPPSLEAAQALIKSCVLGITQVA